MPKLAQLSASSASLSVSCHLASVAVEIQDSGMHLQLENKICHFFVTSDIQNSTHEA